MLSLICWLKSSVGSETEGTGALGLGLALMFRYEILKAVCTTLCMLLLGLFYLSTLRKPHGLRLHTREPYYAVLHVVSGDVDVLPCRVWTEPIGLPGDRRRPNLWANFHVHLRASQTITEPNGEDIICRFALNL